MFTGKLTFSPSFLGWIMFRDWHDKGEVCKIAAWWRHVRIWKRCLHSFGHIKFHHQFVWYDLFLLQSVLCLWHPWFPVLQFHFNFIMVIQHVGTIFGQLWRLEPLPEEKKSMWRREMELLLCVGDHIVELIPSWQTFPDGSKLEVILTIVPKFGNVPWEFAHKI